MRLVRLELRAKMNILCIGDIVGQPGRDVLERYLSDIQRRYEIDFTIANLENAASGFGITHKVYNELASLGIDAFTSGNHIYDKREVMGSFSEFTNLVRPLNFAPGSPGQGIRYYECQGTKIAVVNLIGRVFMAQSDCPFQAINRVIDEIRQNATIIIVDFHAETTSEKQAMGWMLDGKATLVFGTHTHVMTADSRLLDQGTAYISDLGMVGARDGILGMERAPIIRKFLTQLPARFEPAKTKYQQFNAVKLVCDPVTGHAISIERVAADYQLTGW